MLDFFATFANTDLQSFPATKAVNSSGGQATDGTEFVANLVNDLWGYMQGLLSISQQTPNGVVESYDNSQLIIAHQRFTIPGMIIPVAWNDTPLNLGIRALSLVGQGVLRSNYPELDEIVYVGDSDNATASAFYHADDSAGLTRNVNGDYLIFPDARGRVVRGLDLTGSVDPDGASASLGGEQEDQLQGHRQTVEAFSGSTSGGAVISQNSSLIGSPGIGIIGAQVTTSGLRELIASTFVTDGTNGTPRIGDQTRAKSILLDYIITY